MKVNNCVYEDCTLSVFQMNTGEAIARHRHSHTHSTNVVRGSSEIEIWCEPHLVFQMKPGDFDFVFEADIDHEIRALEDDTIVVNLRKSQPSAPPVYAKSGGIQFDDGTVIW